jgi:hypothetical protein
VWGMERSAVWTRCVGSFMKCFASGVRLGWAWDEEGWEFGVLFGEGGGWGMCT